MIIAWMPYLRIAYPRGTRELRIGQVRFIPDDQAAWDEVVCLKRPSYLNLFRDFPETDNQQPGDPAHGTLIIPDDDEWLTQFIDVAVATLYFLGDKLTGRPAECFTYLRIPLSKGSGEDMATFYTKHGIIVCGVRSATVTPPLVTAGHSIDYRLDLTRTANTTLLNLVSKNPMSRLAVAVRQYFRAQLSEFLSSTPAEDFARYCSSLEAAFDIDGRHAAGEKFVTALCDIFGHDAAVEQFFRGLYVARSISVHGVADESVEGTHTEQAAAYRSFVQRPWKLSLLRMITRTVLLRKLGDAPSAFGLLTEESPDILMSKVLRSELIWEQCRPLLTHKMAADRLIKMDRDTFRDVEQLALDMKELFEWNCVLETFKSGAVYRALITCAIVIGRITNSSGAIYAASNALGDAAYNRDDNAIRAWCAKHSAWEDVIVLPGNRLYAMQAFMWALANYFVTKK